MRPRLCREASRLYTRGCRPDSRPLGYGPVTGYGPVIGGAVVGAWTAAGPPDICNITEVGYIL